MRLRKVLFSFFVIVAFMTLTSFDTEQFIWKIRNTDTRSTTPNKSSVSSLFEGDRCVSIGMSYDQVLSVFGDPVDTQISEYGFLWNIFHDKFENYVQIGILDNRVVGIYTNSPRFSFRGIGVGTSRAHVGLVLESPATYIIKGSTKYVMNGLGAEESFMELYETDGAYVTIFYDRYENNCVTSINIIDYDVEQGFDRLYAQPTKKLQTSFIMQSFYVTNAIRVRNKLAPLSFHQKLAETAQGHAEEMAQNNYFDHTDLSGGTAKDRAEKNGVSYVAIGENIAMGAQNPLYMHELLMNSAGHRKNILADFRAMGTGVAYSSEDVPYLAQNFMK